MIFESILCFGVPLLFMALRKSSPPCSAHKAILMTLIDYIVQGHRFDIFENTGCQAALYISVPGVMLMYFPPLLFSVITLIYAGMSFSSYFLPDLIDPFVRYSYGAPSFYPSPPYLRRSLKKLQLCSDDQSLSTTHCHGYY